MKVISGLFSVPTTQYAATGDVKTQILRLLVHECICVYSDRLVNDTDKAIFTQSIDEVLKKVIERDLEDIIIIKDDE